MPGGGGLMPGGGIPIGAPRPGGIPIGGPMGGLIPGGGPIIPVKPKRWVLKTFKINISFPTTSPAPPPNHDQSTTRASLTRGRGATAHWGRCSATRRVLRRRSCNAGACCCRGNRSTALGGHHLGDTEHTVHEPFDTQNPLQ